VRGCDASPAPVLSNSWRTDASVQVGDGEIKKVSAGIDTRVKGFIFPGLFGTLSTQVWPH
jgi:hypothetical protein